MQNTILHLDMDSFFASVEQQANLALAGKPVGVIKGEGRSCIIAASREAKKLGIRTGTSTYDAKKIYPKITLVPADFDKYFSVTKRFIEICSRFSPDLEVFSIDELFLDVSQTAFLFKERGNLQTGVSVIVREIKEAIKKEIGEYITCSIGISYNRLLAKLASDVNKPNGVFEITLENRDEVLFSRKLTDVCGLGFRLEKRLLDAGITNFKSLRQVPQEFLQATFGPFWSGQLKKLSYGEDDSLLIRVGEIPKTKSVSRTFTLYENTTDKKKIKATLRNLCEEASWKARQMGMMGREVGLSVRGGRDNLSTLSHLSYLSNYGHKTLKYFIDSGEDLFEVSWELLKQIWPIAPLRPDLIGTTVGVKGFGGYGGIRFLGVWLGGLVPKSMVTLDIFPEKRKQERLVEAMDKINKKYGELTVYPAILLQGGPSTGHSTLKDAPSGSDSKSSGQRMIKSEVNGFLGDKAFRFFLGLK